MAEDLKTYDNDKSLGVPAPTLEKLDFLRGDKVESYEQDKLYVLFFFVTYYKGAYGINEEITVLSEKYPEPVYIGISNEADGEAKTGKEKTEAFLEKKITDLNTGAAQRMGLSRVAFDDKKVTAKMFASVCDLTVLGCPHIIVVKNGNIVWRQAVTQSYTIADSNFEVQLQHLIKGEPLEKIGDRPVIEEEGEACEVEGDVALF
jgi:hypothetical protein